MRLTVYADFNCPYSYLASQRVDALQRLGRIEVDWRAVEHDPRLSMTGTPTGADRERWERELAEVRALALPTELPPTAAPPQVSNTLAAVSAYAESVTDGVQHELRRALFAAVWVQQRHLSSAYDVRPVITSVTYPPFPVGPYRRSALPMPGYGDPEPLHLTRILGGTIAANGVPMSVTGWRRAEQWRREWLALAAPAVPTVVSPTGELLPGVRGLAYLASLLPDPEPAARPVPAAAPPRPATVLAAAA